MCIEVCARSRCLYGSFALRSQCPKYPGRTKTSTKNKSDPVFWPSTYRSLISCEMPRSVHSKGFEDQMLVDCLWNPEGGEADLKLELRQLWHASLINPHHLTLSDLPSSFLSFASVNLAIKYLKICRHVWYASSSTMTQPSLMTSSPTDLRSLRRKRLRQTYHHLL